jgi:acetylornithine deacetylase
MLRPMPEIDGEDLVQVVRQKASEFGLEFRDLEGGASFWNDPNASCVQEICKIVGKPPKTVCYGTDGGELKELENRIVLGPGDIAQAHTTDEWIKLDQLQKGSEIYEQAIRRWCT